ncbi:MAG: hypothetical protein JSS53_03825 [Proteobacteria bacterium]|nr:hypothetical protein [Pseudomonadota bacterium]
MSKVAMTMAVAVGLVLFLSTPEGQAFAASVLGNTALGSTVASTNDTVPVIAGDGSVGSDVLVRGLVDLAWFATGLVCASVFCFAFCCVCLCCCTMAQSNGQEQQKLLLQNLKALSSNP